MSGYVRGNVLITFSLDTLAAATLVSATLTATMTESGRISSIIANWNLSDFVDAAGDGPILVGYAHSDYTDAEISAAVTNTGNWDRGDKIQEEIGRRLVRTIGQFGSNGVALSNETLNDGRPVKTKLNWGLTTGDTLKLWAFNQGSSALGTGSSIEVQGHANLWIKY